MIVVVEGVSNAGKTTFAKLLCAALLRKGVRAALVNDAISEDVVYKGISKITNPKHHSVDGRSELFLYAASLARKALVCEQLKSDNHVVILDRFTGSFSAYFSSATVVEKALLENICHHAARSIAVDLCVSLQVSLSEVERRAKSSPFSRKDIGLGTYFTDYCEELARHCEATAEKLLEIDAEHGVAAHVDHVCDRICKERARATS